MSRLAEVGLVSLSGCRSRGFGNNAITSDRTSAFGGHRVRNDSRQSSEVIPYLVMINVADTADGDLGSDIDLQTGNHLNHETKGKRRQINKASKGPKSINQTYLSHGTNDRDSGGFVGVLVGNSERYGLLHFSLRGVHWEPATNGLTGNNGSESHQDQSKQSKHFSIQRIVTRNKSDSY
jgi:hypothetical protein